MQRYDVADSYTLFCLSYGDELSSYLYTCNTFSSLILIKKKKEMKLNSVLTCAGDLLYFVAMALIVGSLSREGSSVEALF